MKEVEFNLLDEPWVRVLCADCTVREVSLTEALLHAHSTKAWLANCPRRMWRCCGYFWRGCTRYFPAWMYKGKCADQRRNGTRFGAESLGEPVAVETLSRTADHNIFGKVA